MRRRDSPRGLFSNIEFAELALMLRDRESGEVSVGLVLDELLLSLSESEVVLISLGLSYGDSRLLWLGS